MKLGARNAFTKVFNDYARRNGLLKEKGKNFEGSDVREGLTDYFIFRHTGESAAV